MNTLEANFLGDTVAIVGALPNVPSFLARVDDSLWRRADFVTSTGSTNADLVQRLRAGEDAGAILVAGEQTAGRGRLARAWESPAGSSVAMSLSVEPTQPIDRWGWLSLLAGVAVAEGIRACAPGLDVGVKWPNDVLIAGRKVCGILSERVERDGRAFAVVGIGINVSLTREQLPVPTATSLALEGVEVEMEDLVAEVCAAFAMRLREWDRDGHLRDAYEAVSASIGAELTITLPGGALRAGRGVGVAEDGAILVESERGVEAFNVGDVVHATLAP